MKKNILGLNLIEMMVAVAIAGILATIAVYSYQGQVRKGRRIDAIETMLAISLAEERYRTQNGTYGTLGQVWNGVTSTNEGYYTIAISNLSSTTYTITATAVGDQANDSTGGTACNELTLASSGSNVSQTPSDCWPN